jgi:uncharacterized protein (TIGR03437 family)
VNAASYLPSGLPNAGLAQGSIFVIFGDGLGPGQIAHAPGIPLETQLAGTQVRFESAGTSYAVPLVYTSANQLAGIVPSVVPVGEAEVIANYNGVDSNRLVTRIRKSAFGIFTQNQAGFGPAIVQNWNAGSVSMNGLHSVIAAGGIAILWGTGLGPISQSDAEAPPVGDLPTQVQVLVGDHEARVLYHGRAPGFAGLDQINFEVPEGVVGCYVPIVVRADGVASNFASMSIVTSGSICGDDVSWRGRLWAGTASDVRVGIVEMRHEEYSLPAGPPIYWSEIAEARFFGILWNDINSLSRLSDLQVLPGTCTVVWNRWNNSDEMTEIYQAFPNLLIHLIQAGSYLKIQGPPGQRHLDSVNPGEYEAHLGGMTELGGLSSPRFMNPGNYIFDNLAPPPPPGQSSPPPPETYDLQVALPVLGEIQWTNKAQLTELDRGRDLRFEWSGGMDAREYVLMGGSSADEALKSRVTFICAQDPSAGAFTVPSWILEVLPRSSPSAPDSYPYGYLFMGSSSNNVNSLASNVAFGTLNMLYFRYRFLYYSIVNIH